MSRLSGFPFEGSVDFASIADGDEAIVTIPVPGARRDRGDAVAWFAAKGSTFGGLSVFAEVDQDGQIRLIGHNNTGATINLAAKTVVGHVVSGE